MFWDSLFLWNICPSFVIRSSLPFFFKLLNAFICCIKKNVLKFDCFERYSRKAHGSSLVMNRSWFVLIHQYTL